MRAFKLGETYNQASAMASGRVALTRVYQPLLFEIIRVAIAAKSKRK